MNPDHEDTSKNVARTVGELYRLQNKIQDLTGRIDLDDKTHFEKIFALIREMRGAIRQATVLPKSERATFRKELDSDEAYLKAIQARALELQPSRIEEVLTEFESVIRTVETGQISQRAAWSKVSIFSLFFRKTHASLHRVHGRDRFNTLVRRLKAANPLHTQLEP